MQQQLPPEAFRQLRGQEVRETLIALIALINSEYILSKTKDKAVKIIDKIIPYTLDSVEALSDLVEQSIAQKIPQTNFGLNQDPTGMPN